LVSQQVAPAVSSTLEGLQKLQPVCRDAYAVVARYFVDFSLAHHHDSIAWMVGATYARVYCWVTPRYRCYIRWCDLPLGNQNQSDKSMSELPDARITILISVVCEKFVLWEQYPKVHDRSLVAHPSSGFKRWRIQKTLLPHAHTAMYSVSSLQLGARARLVVTKTYRVDSYRFAVTLLTIIKLQLLHHQVATVTKSKRIWREPEAL